MSFADSIIRLLNKRVNRDVLSYSELVRTFIFVYKSAIRIEYTKKGRAMILLIFPLYTEAAI